MTSHYSPDGHFACSGARRGMIRAGVLAAAFTIALVIALIGSLTAGGRPAAAKTLIADNFRFYNFSRYALKLLGTTGSLDGAPPTGQVLLPGHYDDFLATYYLDKVNHVVPTYEVTRLHSGVSIGKFSLIFRNGFLTNYASSCAFAPTANYGLECAHVGNREFRLEVVDKPGLPPLDFTPAEKIAQANLLSQLCIVDDSAKCGFVATSEEHILGEPHQISDTITNKGARDDVYSLAETDTVEQSNSVGVEVKAGVKLAKIVSAEIAGTYMHTWTESHEFARTLTVTIPPNFCARVVLRAPIVRDTGNFTITLRNTTWRLTGVYFDSPDLTDKAKRADWTTETAELTPEGCPYNSSAGASRRLG